MSNDDKPRTGWKPINFGWKYLNYVIIAVGLIVGFAVWVLPNQWADPDVQAGIARTKQRVEWWKEKEANDLALKAEQERIAKYNEEVGLIYIDPGTNPFLPPESKPQQ